jgi:hypothetical protein
LLKSKKTLSKKVNERNNADQEIFALSTIGNNDVIELDTLNENLQVKITLPERIKSSSNALVEEKPHIMTPTKRI